MNIFRLDDCPVKSAIFMCNKHIVKMALETCQILHTNLRLKGVNESWLYKPFNPQHPSVQWARISRQNFMWLINHGISICNEYNFRYHKNHKCFSYICRCREYVSLFDDGPETPLLLAMPEKYKTSDAVHSYRLYYAGEKYKFAQWHPRSVPYWWETYRSLIQNERTFQ